MYLNREVLVSRKFGSFYTESPGHRPIATETPAIQHAGLSLDRCIQSNPEGRDELLRIQSTLVSWLEWIRTQTRDDIPTEDAA